LAVKLKAYENKKHSTFNTRSSLSQSALFAGKDLCLCEKAPEDQMSTLQLLNTNQTMYPTKVKGIPDFLRSSLVTREAAKQKHRPELQIIFSSKVSVPDLKKQLRRKSLNFLETSLTKIDTINNREILLTRLDLQGKISQLPNNRTSTEFNKIAHSLDFSEKKDGSLPKAKFFTNIKSSYKRMTPEKT